MLALLDYRVRGCVLAVWNSRHLMYGYTVDIHILILHIMCICIFMYNIC